MVTTCKKCNTRFYSQSTLRKHQWRDHREMYEDKIKERALIKVINEEKPEMTVRELLMQLRGQKTFIHDVVALLEKMIGDVK